jgi:hypothetical protein
MARHDQFDEVALNCLLADGVDAPTAYVASVRDRERVWFRDKWFQRGMMLGLGNARHEGGAVCSAEDGWGNAYPGWRPGSCDSPVLTPGYGLLPVPGVGDVRGAFAPGVPPAGLADHQGLYYVLHSYRGLTHHG